MAFLLGSFTNGMFSSLNDTMKAGKGLMDFKKEADMMSAANDAANAGKANTNNSATSGAGTPISTGSRPQASSDSAMSAPSSTTTGPVDLNSVVPPKYMGDKQNILSDSAMSGPGMMQPAGAQAAPYSPVGHSGGHFNNPGVSTAPSNMQTFDDPQGMATQQPPPLAPVSQRGSGPDMSHLTNKPVGGALGDWLHGRQQPATLIPQQQQQAVPTQKPQQPAPPIAAAPNASTPSLAQQTGGLGARLLSAMGNGMGTGY